MKFSRWETRLSKEMFGSNGGIIREGHAAILVSHAMPVVRRSVRCALVEPRAYGYVWTTMRWSIDMRENRGEIGSDESSSLARFISWKAESRLTSDPHTISAGHEEVSFRFEVELATAVRRASSNFLSQRPRTGSFQPALTSAGESVGKIMVVLTLPSLPLSPGFYSISCTISNGKRLLHGDSRNTGA